MRSLPGESLSSTAAAFLVFERPDLLSGSLEAQASGVGLPVEEFRGVVRSTEFRRELDKFLTWRVLSPDVRLKQLHTLKDISLDRGDAGSAVKAFEVLSRQAGVRVPERHEVDDKKSIEVTVSHVPNVEGGFVPEVPFHPPEGWRARLGEQLEKEVTVNTNKRMGPFEFGSVSLESGSHGEDNS